MTTIFREPDISNRPFQTSTFFKSALTSKQIFDGWLKYFDEWFAAKGSMIMNGKVNTVFFFETEHKFEESKPAARHPHYGRFLNIVENQTIAMTWVTGEGGTKGSETILTIQLEKQKDGTLINLTHAGFTDADSCEKHGQAWTFVLKNMEEKLTKFYSQN